MHNKIITKAYSPTKLLPKPWYSPEATQNPKFINGCDGAIRLDHLHGIKPWTFSISSCMDSQCKQSLHLLKQCRKIKTGVIMSLMIQLIPAPQCIFCAVLNRREHVGLLFGGGGYFLSLQSSGQVGTQKGTCTTGPTRVW